MEKIIPREIELKIEDWLSRKEIIAVRGPRQCGKTTLLKKLINVLKEKGVQETNIHYVSFEDDFKKEKFEKSPKEFISVLIKDKERSFFLLDEVQYIKNAGKLLKLIYDEFENIKMIITGSSAMDLNEIGSFLVGRVILFEMYPLSFSEFLNAKAESMFKYYNLNKIKIGDRIKEEKELIFIDKLNDLLKEYLIFGGYPAVVLEPDNEKKKILLKNMFQTYIEKDIVKIYGSKYSQRITDLIRHLASINSSMINYNEISSSISLYEAEVKEMLGILEQTYVIKLIKPFHKNLTTELKKNPKVYFIDTGLRNFSTERWDFAPEEYGKLLETYVFGLVKEKKTNYWRTTAKAEVDFIINGEIPIEAKITPKISRSFRSFIDHYNPERAYLANMNILKKEHINKTPIFLIPFCILAKPKI
jgi:predicted AAA+ superfamily ATPase